MSGRKDIDLSGDWSGIYNYPALYPPNTFEATIRDSGGLIAGVTREPGDWFDPPGTIRHAVIEGNRDGSSLHFVKIYDELDLPTLHYRGVVDPGGDEIEGEWTNPEWSGTFLMIRGSKTSAEVARRIGEEVR